MSPNTRPAVVLVNRCFVLKKGRILAIQRTMHDRNNPGLWEAPGGKLDEGQDLDRALEREVMEETGFLIRPIDSLAHFESRVLGGNDPYSGMPYVVLFGIAEILGGEQKISNEHDDARWCSYKELLDLELTPETRKAAIVLKKRLTNH